MNGMIEIIVSLFILTGTLLSLLSSFGFIRLPDVYTRSHAGTKSITLGLLCILLGVFLYFWLVDGHFSIRLILGIVFVFITAPVAGHLICRAAHRSGVQLAEESVKDELQEVLAEKNKKEFEKEAVDGQH